MDEPQKGAQRAKRERIATLVKDCLWSHGPLHPATVACPAALFEALAGVSEAKGKSHMLHKQEGELHIFHYGQLVQNTACWTPELLLARGLVFRKSCAAVTVVATPWPKFFNLGEDGLTLAELEAAVVGGRVEATSKMDGSLGLLFFDDGAWRVTTKGSFASTQGVWATAWLHQHVNVSALTPGMTYLVEIIYPENRIVIPYTFSALVLLSAFDTTGRELARDELEAVAAASRLTEPEPEPGWTLVQPEPEPEPDIDARYGTVGAGASGLSLPELHSAENLHELMAAVQTWTGAEREGIVLRFVFRSGASHRVKIKGADYLALHKGKDGFTKKKVHEAIKRDPAKQPNGVDPVEAMRNVVPEEFLPDFDAIVSEVEVACNATLLDVATQWEIAEKTMLFNKKNVGWQLTKKLVSEVTRNQAAWQDGTPFSGAFKALMFAPFIPYECASSDASIPSAPGAWRELTGQSRKMVLGYVMPLLSEQPKSKAQSGEVSTVPVVAAAEPVGPQLSVAEKKKAKKVRLKAKKAAAAKLAMAV